MKIYALFFSVMIPLAVYHNVSASSQTTMSVVQPIEQKIVTLEVPGMFCATCPFIVRKSLEALSGVIGAKASNETKTVIVTYDPAKVTTKALREATKKAGYPSTVKSEV